MKTRVNLSGYTLPDPRTTPAALRVSYAEAVKHISNIMCLAGLRSISVSVIQTGVTVVPKVKFELLDTWIPAAILDITDEVAQIASRYMLLYGITEIELRPSDSELNEIKAGFMNIAAKADTVDMECVKAPPSLDPDGTPVDIEVG